MFSCRLHKFRDDASLGGLETYGSIDLLWDTLLRSIRAGNRLSTELNGIVGFYVISLLASIILQGLAVFVFQGEWFSLVILSLY